MIVKGGSTQPLVTQNTVVIGPVRWLGSTPGSTYSRMQTLELETGLY